ncbi:ankyrin repeat domain-containing protein 60-like [Polypterus senegalus]
MAFSTERRTQKKSPKGERRPGFPQSSLKVHLEETGEAFTVRKCRGDTTVKELKEGLELLAGVPMNLQRLCYLDRGDLLSDSTLRFYDIVPGGTVTLKVWHYDGYQKLVKAAAEGDVHLLSALGVTPDTSYATPNSSRMSGPQWTSWIAERAAVALYVAAHRGHQDAVKFLLQRGASMKYTTPLGRTALHAAAAMGHGQCIELLLEHGAPIHARDKEGLTALELANQKGQKKSSRQLYLFQWKQRAAGVRVKTHLDVDELFAHQRFDSKLKTWHTSPLARIYMANLQKPGEFQGTSLSAPSNVPKIPNKAERLRVKC